MKVYYHKMRAGNFGDDLNAELWDRAIPGLANIRSYDWLVGIGTILDKRIDQLDGRKIVLGSGYRLGNDNLPRLDESTKVGFVRGPLTAKALGLDASKSLCDPALIVPAVMDYPAAARQHTVGFVPHVHSVNHVNMRSFCAKSGLTYIDPTLSPKDFIPLLKSVDRVITEAMHGAITADAYGIPWSRVRFFSWKTETPAVAEFKWNDWAKSLSIDASPVCTASPVIHRKRGRNLINRLLQPANALVFRRMVKHCQSDPKSFRTSDESLRKSKTAQILDLLSEIR